MLISTVMPTINRRTLTRAVTSVLEQQTEDEFQLILINDSGRSLPDYEWRRAERVTVINTNHRERCAARNAGSAVATGRYLHFLDDDDWLLPGAFAALGRKARESNARWLYGVSQLVDRQGNDVIELRNNLSGNVAARVFAGEWIPLQSSFVDADLYWSLGGFRMDVPALNHSGQDIDLMRRLSLATDIVGVDAKIACIGMGADDSTTNYSLAGVAIRAGRESALDCSGTLMRLLASADCAYLKGRVVRVYLTSVIWNLRQRRVLTGVSRGLKGVASFLRAGSAVLSTEFWHALTRQYRNESFSEGFRRAGRTDPSAEVLS